MLILDKQRAIDRIVALTEREATNEPLQIGRPRSLVAAYEPREPAVTALQRRPSRRRARRATGVASLLY